MVDPNCNNPYQSPGEGRPLPPVATQGGGRNFGWVFVFSYGTSLVVAMTTVTVWVTMMILAAPPGQRRTELPDILEIAFVVATTFPSLLTCLGFSLVYCLLIEKPGRRPVWPGILFGALSGLAFNAMTGITLIEYFFEW